jgi:hypothetical protein
MNRRWQTLAPLVAPALLGVIAVAQMSFAHFSTLSAWKGGGFGMFSTVDSPGARFLRIYLVTDRGEVPVLVPPDQQQLARELRTTGSAALATALARTLADARWVSLRLASAEQYYRRLLPDNVRPEALPEPRRGPAARAPVIDLQRYNFVRTLKAGESPGADDTVLTVKRVRVELWKYAFDKPATTLNAEKFIEVRSGPTGTSAS